MDTGSDLQGYSSQGCTPAGAHTGLVQSANFLGYPFRGLKDKQEGQKFKACLIR